MVLSQLKVVLTATSSGFNRTMKKAADRTQNFRNRLGKMAGTLKNFGGQIAIAAAAVTGIGIALKKAFDIGASIAETQSKFNTVFGPDASAQVQGFLDDFANKAGLTNTEAQGLVATTGAIAQGLGFSQKASGEFAASITALAGDLSSFNNIPTAETLLAINSALTGERESLKRLGIVIKETDVQQRALADSGKSVAKALTAQEKATATLALISERAGVAVGDLDRTQGSAANVARRLAAQFKEIRDAIATALMPAFKQILDRLASSKDRFDDLKEAITENSGIISAWASLFINLMRLSASPLITLIRLIFNMGQIAIDATKALGNLLEGNWEALAQNAADMKKNFGDIGETIVGQFEVVGETLQSIADVITGGVEPAAQKATGAMNNLATAGAAAGEDIAAAIEDAAETIESLQDKSISLAESFAKNFVSSMTNAAQGGKNAFEGFFTFMKNRIIQLAMQYALFKTLTGIFGESDFITALTGFGSGTPGPVSSAMQTADLGGIGGLRPKAPHLITARSGVSQSGMTVNQNINFTVSAIDARDAARFIQEQKGTIAGVMAEATQNSRAYRNQLLGAV
tara:strand:- start:6315 stop:8045 length:1731 start_codon:yes stop_codon:yes gene_type:complete